MEIELITEKLNEWTNNEFGFVLRSANLHANNACSLEFGYNDGCILNKQKRQECQLFLLKLLPEGFIYDIKFTKNYITDETIKVKIDELSHDNFPALVYAYDSSYFKDGKYVVTLKINENFLNYAKFKNIQNLLEIKLKENFLADFIVELKIDDSIGETEEITDDEEFVSPQEIPRIIEVTDISSLCGDKVTGPANYIKDMNKPMVGVTLCGTVKYLKINEIKKKTNNLNENKLEEHEIKDAEEKPEEQYVRKYLKFVLQDFTGEINCIYFANKTTISNAEKLQDGSQIIAFGNIEENKFSSGLDFKIKNISLCLLPAKFEEPIIFKPEPEHYKYVFPQPYIQKEQVDLFHVLSNSQEETVPYLKTHDVVVFDFETTGLSATDCKIIEIGAVKISGGKITEQFETFVDPEEHIDEESTKIHGIVDSDVSGSPTYKQALQDFYKFTRNTTLVAYNIGFDYSFLSLYGTLAGYNFDNPQIDALKLASKNVKGVKNYKLKTIADHLGVLLDNAHRAVYDAIATAEVFIKLAKYIEE